MTHECSADANMSVLCEPQRKGAPFVSVFCRMAVNVLVPLFLGWGAGGYWEGRTPSPRGSGLCCLPRGSCGPGTVLRARVSEASNWVRKCCTGRTPPPPINSRRPPGPGPRAQGNCLHRGPSPAEHCRARAFSRLFTSEGPLDLCGDALKRSAKNPRMLALQGASSPSA